MFKSLLLFIWNYQNFQGTLHISQFIPSIHLSILLFFIVKISFIPEIHTILRNKFRCSALSSNQTIYYANSLIVFFFTACFEHTVPLNNRASFRNYFSKTLFISFKLAEFQQGNLIKSLRPSISICL